MKRNHLDGSLFEPTIELYCNHLKLKLLAHNILETTLLCTNYTSISWCITLGNGETLNVYKRPQLWLVPLLLVLRLFYSTISIASKEASFFSLHSFFSFCASSSFLPLFSSRASTSAFGPQSCAWEPSEWLRISQVLHYWWLWLDNSFSQGTIPCTVRCLGHWWPQLNRVR